jgi:hypothetical protein
MEDVTNVVPSGTYRHFKGNLYQVLFCARHSEDLGVLVVYKNVNNNMAWARPLEEFLKTLPNGDERFVLVK